MDIAKPMVENDIDQFLKVAYRAADNAGEILRNYFSRPMAAELKADLSPVTLADKDTEAAIFHVISQAFPDHGIMGEETEAVNPDSAYQWVIDPIDGTRAFIAGYPTFTTLIALCMAGEPVLGIIDQPILKKRWVGEMTFGTPPTSLHPVSSALTLATTSMDYFTKEQKGGFNLLRTKAQNVILGGDAYAYAMLSSGRIDAVVDVAMKPYDYMALVPVVTQAGGVITDWSGNPLTLKSAGDVLACSNRALHDEFLELLND